MCLMLLNNFAMRITPILSGLREEINLPKSSCFFEIICIFHRISFHDLAALVDGEGGFAGV